jgi:acetamidase/formamidase
MGIYGVAPDDDGPVPTAHPGPHGGNLDCQELGGGVTLFLPVFVPGALFSVGDGHGAQGDGEVNGAAIETGMDRLEIQLIVRKDLQIERPRAESATHLIFLAFGEDLDAALLRALRDVMAYLMEARGLSKDEAYSLASLAVDFRITQVVDGPRGVHAMLPKAIFTADPPTWRRE